MTTTFNINLSSESPLFTVTLGDGVAFTVTTGAQLQPLPHKSSHSLGGADQLRPEDIGAQGLFESGVVQFTGMNSNSVALEAARAKTWSVTAFAPGAYEIILPSTGKQVGDIAVLRTGTIVSGATVAVKIQHNGYTTTAVTLTAGAQSVRYVSSNTSSSGWAAEPVSLHTHVAANITDFTAAVTAIVNAIRPL
jgi:hypothetical protein